MLTLFGLLGWLSLPKCPLCLATYLAMGSGMTLSFAESQDLRQLWLITVTAMMLFGICRLATYGRQGVRSRLMSQTPRLDLSVREPD